MPDTLIVRALAGAFVAGIVAWLARRAGTLTPGGRWAAFATGTVVAAAGWRWAALLIAYFVIASWLTHAAGARKEERTRSVLPTHRERNVVQVLANGGLFAAAILAGELSGDDRLRIAALGALAAAMADTWATEIGLLSNRRPRSIVSWRPLAPGLSGGITLVGTAASVGGACLLALAGTWLLGLNDRSGTTAVALALGGIGGSLVDSILGATLQSKRWCDQCHDWTERRVHACQYRTRHAAGIRWMSNDLVNFLATAAGAIIALLLWTTT